MAARTYGPDLIYVATGPLSNLALALERDAAAMMSIGRVVVMGGALTVPGNVSAGAEANMASDPEAADAVLRSGRKLTMVGLDVTHRVVLTRRDIAGWTGSGTMAGCAFASMVEHYIGSYEMNAPYLGGCALHDPLAVAVAIDPTLVGALGCNLRVDLLGEYRGRTICDERRLSDPDKSALVALTVDAPALPVRVQDTHGPRPGLIRKIETASQSFQRFQNRSRTICYRWSAVDGAPREDMGYHSLLRGLLLLGRHARASIQRIVTGKA